MSLPAIKFVKPRRRPSSGLKIQSPEITSIDELAITVSNKSPHYNGSRFSANHSLLCRILIINNFYTCVVTITLHALK